MPFKIRLTIFFGFIILLPAFGQQNYFNVPSYAITPKDKIFFQEQFNIFDELESNSTFDYGLGEGFEIGANFYSLQMKNPISKNALVDDVDSKNREMWLLNFMKSYQLDHQHSVAIGTQQGVRYYGNGVNAHASMSYLAYTMTDPNKYRFSIGPFHANSEFAKKNGFGGIQAGFEYPLSDVWNVVIDSIGGISPISVTVIGVLFEVAHEWTLSLGQQFPNGSQAGQAFVMEFTHVPK